MATHAPSPSSKAKINRTALRVHGALAYLAAAALLVWGCSGLIHPWITTFGVQQVKFKAPQHAFDLSKAMPVDQVLQRAGIGSVQAVAWVASERGHLLQVTEQTHLPRRYFNTNTGEELKRHDPKQAEFLARHYLGLQEGPAAQVEWVSEFTSEYPAVNRLLPVYRVVFEGERELRAYIYTETSSVALVLDKPKALAQQWFQWLHTWSWWPVQQDGLRVFTMAIGVSALMVLSLSGLLMLIFLRRTRAPSGARGVHRKAAYVLFLPVAALSFSGLFHLVMHSGTAAAPALRMQQPIPTPGELAPLHSLWPKLAKAQPVQGVSLVHMPAAHGEAAAWLYRVATPMNPAHAPGSPQALRQARFDGVQPSGPAWYLDAATGAPWPEGDQTLARRLGHHFTGLDNEALQSMRLVTRFGGDYDFRNKRLPVWQLDYGAPLHSSVFIDTATGTLADIKPHSSRLESWSFSMLHKWNFLQAAGRNTQNIALALAVLLAMGLMGGMGISMRKNRKRLPNLLRKP